MLSPVCSKSDRLPGVLLSLLVALTAWFAVIRILWNDWRIDPQYSYGILVPLLVLGLFFKRWEDRPAPLLLSRLEGWYAAAMMLASTLLLALVIPLAEANPDWRPLGWVAAVGAVGLSLGLLLRLGGGAWLRHFAFPLFFFLISVPWPRNFEREVMALLMSWNTMTTVELLHWGGFEAMRQGNLILLPVGVLGVEEACSGVRSLQSGMMVALFFGEVFRLSWGRRLLLLLIALAAALLGNIVRSFLLAWIASTQSIAAVSSWHDSAGLGILLLTVSAVVGSALLWRKSGRNEGSLASTSVALHPLPSLSLIPLLLVLFLSLVGTEGWFRLHEWGRGVPVAWEIAPRAGRVTGVTSVEIPEATRRMLFYPGGFSEMWDGANREHAQAFYFRWPPGRTAAQAVNMHNPETCLAGIGMRLQKRLEPVLFEDHGVTLPLQSWLFDDHGQPVYVFHANIQDQEEAGKDTEVLEDSPKGRLRSLLLGRRNSGERVVEVAFWKLSDELSARQALHRYLNQVIFFPSASSPSHP